MRYVLITDTHFGHKKLIQYGRPDNFEDLIMRNCQAFFQPSDVIIHLGDVSMGAGGQASDLHKRFTALPGKKVLVKGNHDQKSDSWYYDQGWDFVCKQFYLKYFGKRISFSHIPHEKMWRYDYNVHGHFHDSDHRRREPELLALYNKDFHRLLAIEYTNYQPVLLETFLKNDLQMRKTI